jgi:hypothetical protein
MNVGRNTIGVGIGVGIASIPAAFYTSWYWLLLVLGCVTVIAGGFLAVGEEL